MNKRYLVTLAMLLACSGSKGKEASETGQAGTPVAETPVAATGTAETPVAPDIQFRNMRVFDNVYVGGQPTPEELRQAVAKGVTTVVNLRASDEPGVAEQERLVAELGVNYVAIPVSSPDDLDRTAAQKLDDALASAQGKPVIVHCASGNRVGALFAIRAHEIQNQTPAEALATGLEYGLTRYEDAVRERLGVAQESP